MTQPQTVILIQGSDLRGHWYEAAATDEATAAYYLAQLAARQHEELGYDSVGRFYQIGHHDYDLYTLEVFNLDQVNALRKEHEQ